MGCRIGPSPGSGAAEHPQRSIGQVQKVLIFPHVGAALVQKCVMIRPIHAGVAPCQELLELGQWVMFWRAFFRVLSFSALQKNPFWATRTRWEMLRVPKAPRGMNSAQSSTIWKNLKVMEGPEPPQHGVSGHFFGLPSR